MSTAYFPDVPGPIAYEGTDSKNPLSFKHYDANAVVMSKPMKEHLRFAGCYWHSMRGAGADPFGPGTRIMPWEDGGGMEAAENTMHAMFEFLSKLTLAYWCFHDRDIAPEAKTLSETNKNLDQIVALAKKKQDETGIELLWGTTNAFSHPRFMSGASTSPNADVFAHAAAQVKKAMECTQELGGSGYVFWGGREGYETLLNTDLKREMDHLGLFLNLAVDYKKKIGFDGPFWIEPKPKEPTKHQYDFDAGSCHAFLQKYGLMEHFGLNIEANHATLAGHTFHHEIKYCVDNGLLGSIDANAGDLLLGWDTDQFPMNLYDTALVMYEVLRNGGFTQGGGLNFDAKVRRQSTDPIDLVYAHIGGMDAFARGLKIAAKMHEDGAFAKVIKDRYSSFDSGIGADIESGKADFESLAAHAEKTNIERVPSGRQELLENMLNDYL